MDAVDRLITEMREEGEGSRDRYYELYGSGIRNTLVPLADLLDASKADHPDLVQRVLEAISWTKVS